MLRGADCVEARGLRCSRGTDGTRGVERRAAAAPARQQITSESSAPAVPARTCATWLIPESPVGTMPPMSPSTIRPIAVLIISAALPEQGLAIEMPERRRHCRRVDVHEKSTLVTARGHYWRSRSSSSYLVILASVNSAYTDSRRLTT